MYLFLLSKIAQIFIPKNTKDITTFAGSCTASNNTIPIKIGKRMIAPNALVFGIACSIPPTISAKPTNGNNQPTAAKSLITFSAASGNSGMAYTKKTYSTLSSPSLTLILLLIHLKFSCSFCYIFKSLLQQIYVMI